MMEHSRPPGQPSPRDMDEEALTRGLTCNDPTAVSDFLNRTHRPVYAMTARLTGDADLRHDWTHDVLLTIIDELGRGRFVYRRPGCFWSWFQKRTYYLLINLYHQHKKQTDRWCAGEVGEEIIARLPLAKGTDPMRLMENIEARRIVEECLDKLSSTDQRRALHLVLLADQPYQAVADEMGAALNTVRSWIRRARASVRRCVAAKYGLQLGEDD